MSEAIKLRNLETGETTTVSSEKSAENITEDSPWIRDEGTEKTVDVTEETQEDLGKNEDSENNGNKDLKSWARGENSYLSAENVDKGDIITILSEHEMQEYDDGSEYPIIEVEHQGEHYRLRLNKQNTNNIAEAWGWDSKNWIGKQVMCVSKPYYKNLDSEGMILEPANQEKNTARPAG